MTSTVLFEQTNGIAHLKLNNPEKHNSLGSKEIDIIERSLSNLDADTRVVVLSSNGGRTFCGGASLTELASGELTGDRFQAMTNHFASLSVPSICVINGNVFGGGFEMAMSCDFRLGVPEMMMRVPAAALGLCYPIAGIERFVARLGVTTAKRILVGAEEFSAEELKSLGILNWVQPSDSAVEAGLEAARQIASLAPLAVRSMLTIIRQAETGGIDRAKAMELAEICSSSQDLQEGLAAKRERRQPNFKGH